MEKDVPLQPTRLYGECHEYWKRILAYFEDHRTLLFAAICRCFEFVSVSCRITFWGKTEVWGNCYLCPNVEPPQLIVGVGCGVCVYCLSVVDTSSVGTCCRMLVAVLLLLVVVL